MTDHPITPPPELRKQWIDESPGIAPDGHTRVGTDWNAVMDKAAAWRADQALKGPSDEELAECYRKAYYAHKDRQGPAAQVAALRAVLAKWGRQ